MSTRQQRTQVVIVGAGPAGLVLSHMLALQGVASVVLEKRSRQYCESRVRAGVLEHDVAGLLVDTGVGERMVREGLVHRGIALRFDGADHRIPMTEMTGRSVTVYGQQEVVKDLIEHRLAGGADIRFEVEDVQLHDVSSDAPSVSFTESGAQTSIHCVAIAGCDGYHGVCRDTIPAAKRRTYAYEYPFAWLGILAEAAPSTEELIYCCHERGFALYSMRSPSVSRLYLQVPAGESVDAWPDARIWEELERRLAGPAGWHVGVGPTIEKGVTAMRSFVFEPMQHGRLFLAGDASHIVPPTGAKGLNLAVHDALNLADALQAWCTTGRSELLESYTDTCLARVWRAQDFSRWMTLLLHVTGDPFDHQLQLSRLRYVASSEAAAHSLAENYVGLSRVEVAA